MRADGVFSGGGIKGLAVAGAIKAAEEAGYTDWMDLGGTSAGAIAAMALAVGYDADGLQELFSFDFSKLDDRGGPFGLDHRARQQSCSRSAAIAPSFGFRGSDSRSAPFGT